MKPFKKYILLFMLGPVFLWAHQDRTPEYLFKKACAEIAAAFAKQDFKTLNKYIYNGKGVYIITRPGAIDALTKYDSLNTQTFAFYPFKDAGGLKKYSLKYGKAPTFDCGTEKWDKKGFIADSTTRYKRLSELMDFLSKNEMGNYDNAAFATAKEMEGKSRKVVFTELAKKHGVVFYMTLINKKWYLTLIDTVAGDCSA